MQLVEVNDKKTSKQFLDVAKVLYKEDPVWVCPLDQDIIKIFDPAKNAFYRDGNAIRWILKDDDGKLIGRIAAFYNKRKAFLSLRAIRLIISSDLNSIWLISPLLIIKRPE